MPLTYKMQLRLAKEVGLAIAKSYYEIFSDSTNRGPKFTWEEFPNMCRRGAEVHVNIALPHRVKAQQEVENIAGEIAYEEANRLLCNIVPQKNECEEHSPECPWWRDWHACNCGVNDRKEDK